MKLNLGCGKKVLDGYYNTDIVLSPDVHYLDLNNFPYPFKDSSFDEILCDNVLEHLSIDTDLFMSEMYRILEKGGKLIIKVPHFTCQSTYFSQHKKIGFSSTSFDGYYAGEPYNLNYSFGFAKRRVFISFTRGALSFITIPLEMLANLNINLIYESTPLRIMPAKELTIELFK